MHALASDIKTISAPITINNHLYFNYLLRTTVTVHIRI